MPLFYLVIQEIQGLLVTMEYLWHPFTRNYEENMWFGVLGMPVMKFLLELLSHV